MSEKPGHRRSIAKRIAMWTAAVVLLLASYVGGEPFVIGLTISRFALAMPAVTTVFAPLEAYRQSEMPGAGVMRRYAGWGIMKSVSLFAPEDLPWPEESFFNPTAHPQGENSN